MTTPDDRTPNPSERPTPDVSPSPYATGGYIPAPEPGFSLAGTPAPAPKMNRLWLILAAVAGLVVVIAVTIGITVAAQHGSTPAASKASGQSAWDREQAAAATTPDPAPSPAATPAGSDLKLKLKVTSKECFGSAGCLLTVKVTTGYDGPALSPDDTWQVTYEISGVDDGPLIGSFDMTGDQYTVNEENVQTKSSKSKVTVKVTSVEKVGL